VTATSGGVFSAAAKRSAELIDDFCPVAIFGQFFAQEGGLRFGPAGGVGQLDEVRQGGVRLDEGGNLRVTVLQTKLGEEIPDRVNVLVP